MTKPKDQLYHMFAYDESTDLEYSVDFVDQPGGPFWTIANLMSDDSTINDHDRFYRENFGDISYRPDGWDRYTDVFRSEIGRVRQFARAIDSEQILICNNQPA